MMEWLHIYFRNRQLNFSKKKLGSQVLKRVSKFPKSSFSLSGSTKRGINEQSISEFWLSDVFSQNKKQRTYYGGCDGLLDIMSG